MRVVDIKLRRMLAAEFVLGLMSVRTRKRFERLAAADPALREEQRFWERRLAALGESLPAATPPERVWIALSHHIGLIEPNKVVPISRKAAPAPRSASTWRVVAGIAAAVVFALVVVISQRGAPLAPAVQKAATDAPIYVAQLKMPEGDMQWTVSLLPARQRLSVNASGTVPAMVAGHSVELWWISPAGPVALGVLPTTGTDALPLPAGFGAADGATLAVSLEPQGGSPTGKPTGPVLTTATTVKAV